MSTSQPASESQDVELQQVELNPVSEDPPPPAYDGSRKKKKKKGVDDDDLPPPYEDVKDAPPSYAVVFGQMQEAKTKSKNPFDYVMKVMNLLLETGCITTFMIVVLVVPVAMIVIGAMFLNDCPVQKFIPIFLIVLGATFIMKNLADLRGRWRHKTEWDRDQLERIRREGIKTMGSRIICCFLIAFFIAGNVLVFGISSTVEFNDKESANYCHPIAYRFTFWLMIAAYIISALACCILCCSATAAAYCRTGGDDDEE